MKAPVWIETREAIVLHERLARGRSAAPAGLRSRAAGVGAGAPRQRFAYAPESPVFDLAAAYAAGLVGNHPFIDGNKRIGFVVGVLFLELNGYSPLSPSEAEAAEAVFALARGDCDEAAYAAFLAANRRCPTIWTPFAGLSSPTRAAGAARARALHRLRMPRLAGVLGQIGVEQRRHRAHERAALFADREAPAVPMGEAVRLEAREAVEAASSGAGSAACASATAARSTSRSHISRSITSRRSRSSARQRDAAHGGEAARLDRLDVVGRGRRVLHVALRQRADRAGAEADQRRRARRSV